MPNTQIQTSAAIAPYTSMRVGGAVKYLCHPQSEEELRALMCRFSAENIPYMVIGNASNLLFPDEGYDGAVIRTVGIKRLWTEDGLLCASCGVSLSALAAFAQKNGKRGLAFAFGIPGTVGGGIYMNAGAYGGEISDCFSRAVCADRAGNLVTLTKAEMQFAYRHSALMKNGLTVLHAAFACENGSQAEIKAEMERNMVSRKTKQPLEYPSCGSAFKRPTGHFAGALIEQAGLKGLTVGGAQVSEKHAGFVINVGGATANDVKNLLAQVQKAVFNTFGVLLEPEIRIL